MAKASCNPREIMEDN